VLSRDGVGEAIPQIELGRVPSPFSIPRKGIPGPSVSLSVFGTVRTPAVARNSQTSVAASATLALRLRQTPRAASNTAIGDVMDERASSSASASASGSGSRVRMATIADASTNISGLR
jgi:hypothetical protein